MMATTSPAGDLSQPYMVGTRSGVVPAGSHGVPIVAEVRSLCSPSGAVPAASSAPRHSSSPPGHASDLVPPVAGARQLAKLKRFLTSILQYAHDISPDIGDKVQDLVVRVLVSSLISTRRHLSFVSDRCDPKLARCELNSYWTF